MKEDQELVEKITELKHLAENYAHVYSFVGDDSMPIAQEKLYKAIDNFASLCRQHDMQMAIEAVESVKTYTHMRESDFRSELKEAISAIKAIDTMVKN